MKELGHFPIVLPFREEGPTELLNHLEFLDLSSYENILTHNAEGEYGHLHHKQLYRFITEHFSGNIYTFGYGSGDIIINLTADEYNKKLNAIKMYDNTPRHYGGVPTWEKLLDVLKIEFDRETYRITMKDGILCEGESITAERDRLLAELLAERESIKARSAIARSSFLTEWLLDHNILFLSKIAERRQVSRLKKLKFDERYYLRSNPDVFESGMSPLLHFVRHGN